LYYKFAPAAAAAATVTANTDSNNNNYNVNNNNNETVKQISVANTATSNNGTTAFGGK
jgi:hypothetical protein